MDPQQPVRRAGLDTSTYKPAGNSLTDWRARIYVVWFCYVYENFRMLDKPFYAIEELILEFKAPELLDLPDRRLASLYVGAGGGEPYPLAARDLELARLTPHYVKATKLLDNWGIARCMI